jgi:hypothetical protein
MVSEQCGDYRTKLYSKYVYHASDGCEITSELANMQTYIFDIHKSTHLMTLNRAARKSDHLFPLVKYIYP